MKLKIDTFLRDESALELEPNCKLLLDYFKKYTPSIDKEKTLNELAGLYLTEPAKERLDMETKTIEKILKACIENISVDHKLFHGLFPVKNKITYYFFETGKNQLELTLCPHCLTFFNISIEAARNAETALKNEINRQIEGKKQKEREQKRPMKTVGGHGYSYIRQSYMK